MEIKSKYKAQKLLKAARVFNPRITEYQLRVAAFNNEARAPLMAYMKSISTGLVYPNAQVFYLKKTLTFCLGYKAIEEHCCIVARLAQVLHSIVPSES